MNSHSAIYKAKRVTVTTSAAEIDGQQETSMFKIGSRVKIVKVALEELQAYVGRVGVIHNVRRRTLGVRFSNGDKRYFTEEELCLE